ncbi:hypothetical protein B0H19DRAFT_1202220 [Mycena capillaripes]|nr:hypothetical protein B0H19DRAFT_1202220 [Mycena capillaripes]
MPFTAIRRLQILPPIFEVTLICLASSLADVLSSRPAAFVPLPHTRLPAIVSAAYSRMPEGSPMTSLDLSSLIFDPFSHMCVREHHITTFSFHLGCHYSSRSQIRALSITRFLRECVGFQFLHLHSRV